MRPADPRGDWAVQFPESVATAPYGGYLMIRPPVPGYVHALCHPVGRARAGH